MNKKFKQTEIGMIPEEWEVKEIQQVSTKLGDGLHGTPKYSNDGDYFFINGNNLTDDRIQVDTSTKRCEKEEFEKYKKDLNDRTVMVSINGTLGNIALYHGEKVILGKSVCYINVKQEFNLLYIKYVLRNKYFQNYIEFNATGTTIKNVSLKQMREFKFGIPVDNFEQQAISKILSDLDSKIELNQQMNKTLESIGQALFKHWFIDFEFPNEEGKPYKSSGGKMTNSELGLVPSGWEIKSVGEILDLAYGKALKDANRVQGSIPVYGSNGQIGWHDEKLVDGPGIIVGRKGNPGIVTWIHTAFFPIDTTFYVVPKGLIKSMYYLFYALRLQRLPSLGADSAVPGLNRNLVYMNKMVVPSHKILQLFDQHMGEIYNKVQANDEQSRTLATIRDALLPKLMSGEIRVN